MQTPPTRRKPRGIPALLLAVSIAGLADARLDAAEWTQYRGPNHDGVYSGPLRTNWTAQPPKRLWKIPMGPALSSLSISQGRAFTQALRRVGAQDREFVVALDATNGNELWSANLDLADYPNGGVGGDDGPRSTPVVDGDRVYVFTSYLRLYCFVAATGQQLWKRDFPAELGANVVAWQNAASPVIVGDLIYVNANTSPNRLTAIRKSDGTTAWNKHNDTMTQATPIAATIAGVPQIVFFATSGLVSVKPDSGDLLWRFALSFSTSTAASPVVDGDSVYCSAAYAVGSGAVKVEASATGATATQLWKKRNANMNHWATPVSHEGFLYGVYGQSDLSLRCVEVLTGNEKWRAGTVGNDSIGYGSVLKAGNLLFITSDSGEVVLAAPNTNSYVELAHFAGVTGKTWNSPALNDGILYIRSTTEIAAWDLAPPAPASPLKVAPAVTYADGNARVVVRTVDGTPISAARAGKLSLLATDTLGVPLANWLTIPTTPEVVDGAVQLEDANATAPFRFYQAQEKP